MIVKLLTEQHLEFLSLTGGCREARPSLHLSKCQIVGNLMQQLNACNVVYCHLQRDQEDLESKDTKENGARNLRIREDTEKVCRKGHVGGVIKHFKLSFFDPKYIFFVCNFLDNP